jgi:DNA-binding LytR/AlgR family response regulator
LTSKPSPDVEDIEVSIRYKEENEELAHIVALLGTAQQTIIGRQDEKSYPLRPLDIFYFESVDNRVFAYTEHDTFEVKLKLYELERFSTSSLRARVHQRLSITKASIIPKPASTAKCNFLKNGDIITIR